MSTRVEIDFPFAIDGRGRTATTDAAEHIRDMIEQLLFTRPGERVNRPDFGAGLMHQVFAFASPEAATALEYTTRAALQRYLGDVIEVQQLDVRAVDAELHVDIRYLIRASGERPVQTFVVGGPV
jgi:phage baseplate assembly protein W